MKILLLSAYHAASHQYWADGLQKHFNDCDWTVLQLSPRYFAWRIRGNPLSWATRYREELQQKYDLVLVTSMVDLACLRGLVPSLALTPAIVYFHENQFAYPLSEKANSVLEAQLVNLYTAMSAECMVFNSEYNRKSFFQGVDALLKKFPDEKPNDLSILLHEKSRCLAVPLNCDSHIVNKKSVKPQPYKKEDLQVVWNHRWEYDKGPDRLLNIIQQLDPQLKLRFHIVGQQFREQPDVFNEIEKVLRERGWLKTWGYVENRADYIDLLASSDLVLSTALHDFQGLAMMEAAAYGCVPIAPNRLAYPEFFPAANLYRSFEDDPLKEAASAVELIQSRVKSISEISIIDIQPWIWPQMQASYRELFETVRDLEVSCASTKKQRPIKSNG